MYSVVAFVPCAIVSCLFLQFGSHDVNAVTVSLQQLCLFVVVVVVLVVLNLCTCVFTCPPLRYGINVQIPKYSRSSRVCLQGGRALGVIAVLR